MRGYEALLFMTLMVGSAVAQSPAASPEAGERKVVRVEMGSGCGMCGGPGYHTSVTRVERSFIMLTMQDSGDPTKFPKREAKRAITKREWESLVRSIDAHALRVVQQAATCLSCIDLPEAWLVVEYSDGSKISATYSPSDEPAAVKEVKFPVSPTVFNQSRPRAR